MTSANSKPLSDRSVKALKPSCSIKDTGENAGLNVRCSKSGIKTFFYRYRSPSKNQVKQVPIGIYGSISLADARVELAKLKVKRKAGICPATEIKEQAQKIAAEEAERAAQVQRALFTVEDLAEVYLSQVIEDHPALDDHGKPVINKNGQAKVIAGTRKRIKNQREARRTLEAVTKNTKFSKLPAADVTHVDVKKLIESILRSGTPVQAGRVLNDLSLAYTHIIGRPKSIAGKHFDQWEEYLPEETVNPCLQAKAIFSAQRVKFTSTPRDRVLTDNEIRQLLEWLPESKFSQISKHALMITLLTGVRSGEAVGAIRKDIDLDAKTWLLSDTKTGVNQLVQLSTQAINYIKPLLEDDTNKSAYLLPSQRTGKPQWQKQLSEQAWKLRQDSNMIAIPEWTAHDLRRTMRTGLAKLGVTSEVAEAAIGHGKKGIEGTYNLYSYAKEISQAQQLWGNQLDLIAGNVDKVTTIRSKA